MRLRHPHQRRAQRGGLAGVDRDAGAAVAELQRMHIVDAPLAADHDRQPRREGRVVVQRAVHIAAVAAVEQFEVAVDRIRDAGGLGRPRIGGIGVAETALARLAQIGQGAAARQSRAAFRFLPAAPCAAGSFRRVPGAIRSSSQIRTMAWPPMARPMASMACPVEVVRLSRKPSPGIAQRVDGMIHLQRRFRRQPGSEGEDALRLIAGHPAASAATVSPLISRAIVARRPRDQDLRLREQQCARNRSAWACRSAIVGAQSQSRFARARSRVRINRIAATTEKPSSASAVASTAISWRLRSKNAEIVCMER